MGEQGLPVIEALAEELVEFVQPELDHGERLLWAGVSKPRDLNRLPRGRWPILLMIGCFALCVVLLIYGPWHSKRAFVEPLLMALEIGLLLSAVIAMLVAIDQRDQYQTIRDSVPAMTYALSDRRAIIWSPGPRTSAVEVRSYFRSTIKQIHRVEFPNGSGDVLFSLASPLEAEEEEWWDGCEESEGFIGVADVRRVEALVRRALIEPALAVRA